jgi:ferric-dicitrate binding protein FerR (iron transport regulator)
MAVQPGDREAALIGVWPLMSPERLMRPADLDLHKGGRSKRPRPRHVGPAKEIAMAAVHQETRAGQEPNANSTPQRRRDTRALVTVLAVLIMLAAIAIAAISRQPGAGMGGHISNAPSESRGAPAQTP